MTVNRKTRNKSNARRYKAAQQAKRFATELELFGEELVHAVEVDRDPAPTSSLYRMVGTGATGHKGKEVAKLFATGQIASVRRGRGRDACGPVREGVGLTTQRGGELDYLERTTERIADIGKGPEALPGRRADQIDRYLLHTVGGNC